MAPAPGALDPVGEWVQSLQIAIYGYENAAACAADNGTWEAEVGCLFPSESVARFGKARDETWPLSIDISASNGHLCTFEGTARRDGDHWLATAPANRYIPGEAGAEGRFEPADCQVTIYIDAQGLRLEGDHEICSDLCGARAQLWMEGAQRR